jgi:hypothetical protein
MRNCDRTMGIVISGSSPQGQPGAEIHCPGSGKSHLQIKPLCSHSIGIDWASIVDLIKSATMR